MSITGKFTNIPNGNIVPTVSGNRLSATFKMEATFTNPSGSDDCAGGEYRQYVKGVFKCNGKEVTHQLCTTYLSKENLQEDGCPPEKCTAYGYRSCDYKKQEYTPTRDKGCTFSADDTPSITSNPGDEVEIDLSFVGQLIDTKKPDKILAQAIWTVKGTGKLVAQKLSTVEDTITKTNERLSVQAIYNCETDTWDFNVIISRPSGLPPIHSSEIEVQFLDATGKLLNILTAQRGQLTEVGGTNLKSAVAMYQVSTGKTLPASLFVKFREDTYSMNLQ
ncbi:hypothetical protein VF14_04875 [Nostoc linckia z18]|uniref:Uncharacterized protein n=2 Tax=Nostoc linckia TaxID=92942 RepID=A0A9Q5ZES1_NOSLI|nr:hypothetical protein [Nostoc linckia]PHK29961.1 hypothetical protein VF12_30295 [Nostoc linckia z15]PHK47060.1 hypothetical protein VF13_07380 [Nostoc linckia z16]PHJ67595.1 hypothetical protein VF02_05275 [Nostoc linckia z1]PHJ72621.1 hypothetical protein VF05_04235 [Nostoc linckia z3]PHJ73501.1 hypothetical protein VF03_16660 [Nostoc linckia z2]